MRERLDITLAVRDQEPCEVITVEKYGIATWDKKTSPSEELFKFIIKKKIENKSYLKQTCIIIYIEAELELDLTYLHEQFKVSKSNYGICIMFIDRNDSTIKMYELLPDLISSQLSTDEIREKIKKINHPKTLSPRYI